MNSNLLFNFRCIYNLLEDNKEFIIRGVSNAEKITLQNIFKGKICTFKEEEDIINSAKQYILNNVNQYLSETNKVVNYTVKIEFQYVPPLEQTIFTIKFNNEK